MPARSRRALRSGLSELRLFGRGPQGERRALAARDRLGHEVEVAGADLALVPRRGVAVLLELDRVRRQPHVGAQPFRGVALGQLEHRSVQGVEAREGYELEAVAHAPELLL